MISIVPATLVAPPPAPVSTPSASLPTTPTSEVRCEECGDRLDVPCEPCECLLGPDTQPSLAQDTTLRLGRWCSHIHWVNIAGDRIGWQEFHRLGYSAPGAHCACSTCCNAVYPVCQRR